MKITKERGSFTLEQEKGQGLVTAFGLLYCEDFSIGQIRVTNSGFMGSALPMVDIGGWMRYGQVQPYSIPYMEARLAMSISDFAFMVLNQSLLEIWETTWSTPDYLNAWARQQLSHDTLSQVAVCMITHHIIKNSNWQRLGRLALWPVHRHRLFQNVLFCVHQLIRAVADLGPLRWLF